MKTLKTLLFFFSLYFLSSNRINAQWLSKPSIPSSLSGITPGASFVINNKAYIVAGLNGITSIYETWEYDFTTQVWTQKQNYPAELRGGFGFTIGNKGYAGSGWNANQTDFYEFDPIADSWTQKAALPFTARENCISFTYNGKGYAGGGDDFNTVYNDVWEYDPTNDTWAFKTNTPGSPRRGAICFVIGTSVYTGLGSAQLLSTTYNDFWAYNFNTNSWTQKASFSGGNITFGASFVIGTNGYAGVGFSNTANDMWQYNSITDSWEQKCNVIGGGRWLRAGFTDGTYGYVCGGWNGTNDTKELFQYDPSNSGITLSVSSSNSNLVCKGSSVTLTSAGAYSYSWWPSTGLNTTTGNTVVASPTVTTTYYVKGSSDPLGVSAGCTDTKSITITVVDNPIAIGTVLSNVNCKNGNNGSASVSVSSGQSPYNYTWLGQNGQTNNIINGLVAGTYSVRVTDLNGCADTKGVIITQPANSLTSTVINIDDAGCFGQSLGHATVTPVGGTTNYTYSWNSNPAQTTQTLTNVPAGTYSVLVTDANGCTSQSAATITQPNLLVSSAGSSTNVLCTGSSTGVASVNASGGVPSYTYSWSGAGSTQNASTIIGIPAGTYTVIVMDNWACTSQTVVTITQPNNALATTINSTSNVLCNGGNTGSASVNVSGGTTNYTYSWNGVASTQNTSSVTGLTNGTYSVLVIDGNGCTSSVTGITITQPLSALSITVNSTSPAMCGQNNGFANINVNGGTSSYTYLWSNNQTTGTLTNVSSGSYNILITDANGCTAQQNVAIGNSNGPSATIASQTNILCNGINNGALNINVTGGTGSYTYNWLPNVSSTSNANNLSAGNYSVIVTDANNCSSIVTAIINQPSTALSSTLGAINDILCNGNNSGSVNVNVAGGTGNYTYSWSGTNQNTSTITGLNVGVYSVNVTDANGCSTSISGINITQPFNPLSIITNSIKSASCGAINGSASISVTGGTPGYAYSWDNNETNSSATALSSGNHVITVTDQNGCISQLTVLIGNANGPTASLQSKQEVLCKGANTGNIQLLVSGGTSSYTYAWLPNVSSTNSASGLPANTYSITITDANNCTTSLSVTINQPGNALSGTINGIVNIGCNGGTGSATILAAGGTGNYTYLWDNTETTSTATLLSSGNHTVTTTDQNGCITTNEVSISQIPSDLKIDTIWSVSPLCNGWTGTAFLNVSGGAPGYSYSWSNNITSTSLTAIAGTYSVLITDQNGCTKTSSIQISQPSKLSIDSIWAVSPTCFGWSGTAFVTVNGGTPLYTYSWSNGITTSSVTAPAGTYSIVITDKNGCSTQQTIDIAQPLPLIANASNNIDICKGNSATIAVSVSNGTAPYTYSWNNTLLNGAGPFVVNPDSSQSYIVTVSDACGNLVNAQTSVTVMDAPIANFGITLVPGVQLDSYAFSDSSTGNATSWYWDFGNGDNSTEQNPNYEYTSPGNYNITLTVSNSLGCKTTYTNHIQIDDEFSIPNVFSPNGDGINDQITVTVGFVKSFEWVIYDRWGLKIFESQSPKQIWDGRTLAGQFAPEGTYYYLLNVTFLDGKQIVSQKGYIQLIR